MRGNAGPSLGGGSVAAGAERVERVDTREAESGERRGVLVARGVGERTGGARCVRMWETRAGPGDASVGVRERARRVGTEPESCWKGEV